MDSDNDHYDEGDKLVPQYIDDNWHEELQDASGLDNSPDMGLAPPPPSSCH